MITEFDLYDFKGHREVRIRPGRFTVLVGDNASGKTSVLEALAMLSAMGKRRFPEDAADRVRRGASSALLRAAGSRGGMSWETKVVIRLEKESSKYTLEGNCGANRFFGNAQHGIFEGDWANIEATLGTATLYRLLADRVAAGAAVTDPGAPVAADGCGTATVLAAMKLGNDHDFGRVENALRRLVPSVVRVGVVQQAEIRSQRREIVNRLVFDFQGAPGVPARGASSGTLIVLALLTILHAPDRPNLVLLDDIDHALHPRAQMELIRLIRELLELEEFQDVQVLATTHSPYVLDAFDLEDILVCALATDGTVRMKPLAAHPDAQASRGMITPGQLWSRDAERDWVLE